MILNQTFTLSNGVQIPKLGLGTWLIPDNEAAAAVKASIDLGYKHIDTAQAYGNERGVGEGVRAAGIPRGQIFITTKVAAENKSYESAAASIDESLRKLGMDYADLIIIHCPQPWAEFRGAKRYGVTIPQLCIQYTLQLGTVSLPKSSNPDHIKSNVQLDFTISDEDMALLAGIGQDYGDDSWWPVFSKKKQV